MECDSVSSFLHQHSGLEWWWTVSVALLWFTAWFLCVSVRRVLKERKQETLFHMCSSVDVRCEIWDSHRALLPLSSQQHTPKLPTAVLVLAALCQSSALPRSFCHSFTFHQNSQLWGYLLSSLSWLSPLLETLLLLTPLHYYVIFCPVLHSSATVSATP